MKFESEMGKKLEISKKGSIIYSMGILFKAVLGVAIILAFVLSATQLIGNNVFQQITPPNSEQQEILSAKVSLYWVLLHRKSNREELYKGVSGDIASSTLVKTFTVKTGVPSKRPTPLPRLLGRDYWLITAKRETKDNFETAPYFLTLNIPAPSIEPFGPSPYHECNGQCQWELPGAFGLHGVNGDESRLSQEDPGSSGCIRHRDEDITYLYNLLAPEKEEIRYYIEDN